MEEEQQPTGIHSFQMVDGDFDDLEAEVLEKLSWLGQEELQYIHDECCRLQKNTNDAASGKNALLRVILRYLTSREVTNSFDRGMAILLRIKAAINSFEEAFLESRDRKSGILGSQLKLPKDGRPQEFVTTRKKFENFEKLTYDIPVDDVYSENDVDFDRVNPRKSSKKRANEVSDLKRLLRKELKIQGNVGKPGQKETLTFSSLAFQIESAEKKGYGEEDIIAAVIKAINPDIELRSYLERRMGDLSLTMLRRLLRSHYQEKDVTELYNLLSNSCQSVGESPQEFVMRLMNLRQKIMFVSKESDSRICYNEALVQNRFLQSVATGLRSDIVKFEMKSVCEAAYVSDEDLLESLNRAVRDETERQTKLHKKPTAATATPAANLDQNPILVEIKAIKAKLDTVSALQTDIEELKDKFQNIGRPGSSSRNTRYPRKRYSSCATCQKANVQNCTHCFLCGSDDHVMAKCDRKPGN